MRTMQTSEEKSNLFKSDPSSEGRTVITTRVQENYSGSIPHPRLMADWENVIPGSADRILKKFEVQSEHRIDIESRVVRAQNFKQIGGLICGFIVVMFTIGGGIYTALNGHPLLGGSLSFAGLAMIVGAFLSTQFKKPKDE